MAAEHAGADAAPRWLTAGHSALVYRCPQTERARTGAWITTALAGGERVIYKHTGPAEAVRAELAGLVGAVAPGLGGLELADAAELHAETGGKPDALRDWHLEALTRARRDGYSGLALTCDGATLRGIAPEPGATIEHEHELTELSAEVPMRVLCRYDTAVETDADLGGLVRQHAPGLEDITFAAHRYPDRLAVAGAVDAANATRFGAVLSAAVAAGVRLVDLEELEFLAAAGLHALDTVARPLAEYGEHLGLHHATSPVRQVLTLSGLTGSGVVLVNSCPRGRPR